MHVSPPSARPPPAYVVEPYFKHLGVSADPHGSVFHFSVVHSWHLQGLGYTHTLVRIWYRQSP